MHISENTATSSYIYLDSTVHLTLKGASTVFCSVIKRAGSGTRARKTEVLENTKPTREELFDMKQ